MLGKPACISDPLGHERGKHILLRLHDAGHLQLDAVLRDLLGHVVIVHRLVGPRVARLVLLVEVHAGQDHEACVHELLIGQLEGRVGKLDVLDALAVQRRTQRVFDRIVIVEPHVVEREVADSAVFIEHNHAFVDAFRPRAANDVHLLV